MQKMENKSVDVAGGERAKTANTNSNRSLLGLGDSGRSFNETAKGDEKQKQDPRRTPKKKARRKGVQALSAETGTGRSNRKR